MKSENKLLIVTITAIFIVGVFGAVLLSQRSQTAPEAVTSTKTNTTITSNTTQGETSTTTSVSTNSIYVKAGYPKITYNGIHPYAPSQTNYTLNIRTKDITYPIGELQAPAKSLDEAVKSVMSAAGLDPKNYSLVQADFSSGYIYNDVLDLNSRPRWHLSFARIYQGFWIFGLEPSYSSVYAEVDAYNGIVVTLQKDESNLPSAGERFELKVSADQSIETVRHYSGDNETTSLAKTGSITRIEPRIALIGPESRYYPFTKPLDPSSSGATRLYWLVELYSPDIRFGYRGTFLVDAETGNLAVAASEALYPERHFQIMGVTANYSVNEGLTVSKQTFHISGKLLGMNRQLAVVIPNATVIKPGQNGTITIKLTSAHINQNTDVTLSTINPLLDIQNLSTNNTPLGVSVKFEKPLVTVPPNGQAETKATISAQPNAPQGTYLIEIAATYNIPGYNTSTHSIVTLLLSVWNGAGELPPPPTLSRPENIQQTSNNNTSTGTPTLISSDDAVKVAAQSKSWSAPQIASFKIFTELRYLKQNGDMLEIYTADAKTGTLLRREQTLSLKIPDPVVKLRGYYWFVSVNTNPTVPVYEVKYYSYLFWIDAKNATIVHTTPPSG